jgi:hypothetical protein
MKNTVVIFALNSQEAEFALKYIRLHPEYNTKVLAPTLVTQNLLRENQLPYRDYFANDIFNKSFLVYGTTRMQQEARKLTKKIISKLAEVLKSDTVFIKPAQDWLEMEYQEVFIAYKYFQSIEKKWKPIKYLLNKKYQKLIFNRYICYFPENKAVLFSQFFVSQEKLDFFECPKKNLNYFIGVWKIFLNVLNQIRYFRIWISKFINKLQTRMFKEEISPDILLISAGMNLYYYRKLIKSINNLSGQKPLKLKVVVTKQSLAHELLLRKENIDFSYLSNYQTSELLDESNTKTNQIHNQLTNFFQIKQPHDIITKNLPESVRMAIFDKTENLLLRRIDYLVKQTYLAKKIISLLQPKLLITTHDPGPSAMPFVLWARQKHIKTLLLIHGLMGSQICVDYKSKYLAVWGNYFIDWYKNNLNKNKKNIFSLGFPHLDDLLPIRHVTKSWEHLNPIKIGVLLTECASDISLLSVYLDDLFAEAARQKRNYQLIMRYHPGQSFSGLNNLVRTYKLDLKENNVSSIEEYIESVDVVLSLDTSAILWAMIMGKPTFYCSPGWMSTSFPVDRYGGAYPVTSAKDIFVQIEKLIKEPKLIKKLQKSQKKFLKQVLGVLDGTSTEKHLQLISHLLTLCT